MIILMGRDMGEKAFERQGAAMYHHVFENV
jgi:hypothetical protein